MQWITDANNNRASVEYWGSEEEARKSLETLKNCEGVTNCFRCSDCSGCFRCVRCSDCFRCSGCFRCSDCSGCSGCSECSELSPQKTEMVIPVIDDIHKAVYAAVTREGCTLDMRDWHKCETTHCRAGWVVHLAGEAGYSLEKRTSPLFAAQQIYKASGYEISPCRFYDSTEAALEDMKQLAEVFN